MAPPSRSMPDVPSLCPANYARMYSSLDPTHCAYRKLRPALPAFPDGYVAVLHALRS